MFKLLCQQALVQGLLQRNRNEDNNEAVPKIHARTTSTGPDTPNNHIPSHDANIDYSSGGTIFIYMLLK